MDQSQGARSPIVCPYITLLAARGGMHLAVHASLTLCIMRMPSEFTKVSPLLGMSRRCEDGLIVIGSKGAQRLVLGSPRGTKPGGLVPHGPSLEEGALVLPHNHRQFDGGATWLILTRTVRYSNAAALRTSQEHGHAISDGAAAVDAASTIAVDVAAAPDSIRFAESPAVQLLSCGCARSIDTCGNAIFIPYQRYVKCMI